MAQETLHVTDRRKWRAWLKRNGCRREGIWLIFHKKHTGRPRIPYDDAVEEAICFGWIDSTVRRIDDERYMQLFLPRRRNGSRWSALNRRRAEKLMALGLVEAQGMARIQEAKQNGAWREALAGNPDPGMPVELREALDADPRAADAFAALTPGRQKNYRGWVGVAKRTETRRRRAAEVVEKVQAGRDLGLK